MKSTPFLLLVLALPSALAFHGPEELPELEVMYVRQFEEYLDVAIMRLVPMANATERLAFQLPASALNASVTVETSRHHQATLPIEEAGDVWSVPGGIRLDLDPAAFGLPLGPEDRIRVTLVFILRDALSMEYVAASPSPAFRVFVEPRGGYALTLASSEAPLSTHRIKQDSTIYATPASPHAPIAAGDVVRLALAREQGPGGVAPAFVFSGGVLSGALLVGAWGRIKRA